MLLAISMVGTAEAMNFRASLGIDPTVLTAIINTSGGRCWSADIYAPYPGMMNNVPAARGYTGGFGTDLMLNDLRLATGAARQAKQPVVLYQTLSAQGSGGKEFSAIINLFKKP